jgi:hypothetical protein
MEPQDTSSAIPRLSKVPKVLAVRKDRKKPVRTLKEGTPPGGQPWEALEGDEGAASPAGMHISAPGPWTLL